jgi:hypothetical protein
MKKSIIFMATTVFILLTFYLVMPAQATVLKEVEIVADCEEFKATGFLYSCFPWHDGDYVTYAVELTLSNAAGGILTTYSGQSDPISDETGCEYVPFNFTEVWGPLPSGEYTVEGKIAAQHGEYLEHEPAYFGPIIFECGNDVVEGCTLGFWKNNAGLSRTVGKKNRVKVQDNCWCPAYSPGDTLSPIFIFPDDLKSYETVTLIEALKISGSKEANMLRQAVAALLNECSEKVDYHESDAGSVIDIVNAALDTGDYTEADKFGTWNESEVDDVCIDNKECEMTGESCSDDEPCESYHNCPIDSHCDLKISTTPFITSSALQAAMANCGGCGQPACE